MAALKMSPVAVLCARVRIFPTKHREEILEVIPKPPFFLKKKKSFDKKTLPRETEARDIPYSHPYSH